MNRIWVITERELKSYFSSPVAYALLALFGALSGLFFYAGTEFFVRQSVEGQMSGRSFPMNVNEWVIRPALSNLSVVGLFLIPMITMRLFAEEKRTGTMELLLTSPVNDWEIIIGKWLSAVVLYASILGVSVLNVGVLFLYGTPDVKPVLVAYLGLLLQGAAMLAFGAFISTLTKSQIVAGAGTFALCLVLWIINWISDFDPSPVGKFLSYLSVVTHFEPFSKGVIDTKHVIFYVTMIFFGLFLTSRALESVRWRS